MSLHRSQAAISTIRPPCRVRRAARVDAPVIAAFVHELGRHFGDPVACTPEALLHDWDRFEAYLAERDGDPAGLLFGFMTYKPGLPSRGFEVENLVVAAGWRGCGIGQHLLASVIALKAHDGIDRITLSTHANRPDLVAFYLAAGLTRVDTSSIARFRLDA